MKFNPAPDDEHNEIFNRYLSEDGSYFIGLYKVMFGIRVRGGKVNSAMCDIDYCCRDDLEFIKKTLTICIARLGTLDDFSEEKVLSILPQGDKLFRNIELQKFIGLIPSDR